MVPLLQNNIHHTVETNWKMQQSTIYECTYEGVSLHENRVKFLLTDELLVDAMFQLYWIKHIHSITAI